MEDLKNLFLETLNRIKLLSEKPVKFDIFNSFEKKTFLLDGINTSELSKEEIYNIIQYSYKTIADWYDSVKQEYPNIQFSSLPAGNIDGDNRLDVSIKFKNQSGKPLNDDRSFSYVINFEDDKLHYSILDETGCKGEYKTNYNKIDKELIMKEILTTFNQYVNCLCIE